MTITRLVLAEDDSQRAAKKEDERRKYYRLTADGLSVVTAEASRLEAAVGLARTRKVLGKRA